MKVKQSDFTVGRINALSDGVFAIAMTLLVLDLKLPPLESAGDGRGVTAALVVEQLPRFISWILSFAILCRLWIMNARSFNCYIVTGVDTDTWTTDG